MAKSTFQVKFSRIRNRSGKNDEVCYLPGPMREFNRPQEVRLIVDRQDEGQRLDKYLAQKIGLQLELSRLQIRALIGEGRVKIDGRVVRRMSVMVHAGARLRFERGELPPPREIGRQRTQELFAELRQTDLENRILFEDHSLVVVNKPAGLPSQATLDPSRPHLFGMLMAREEVRRGPDAYIGLHHRLDRDTSGVIVFTRNRDANKPVFEQISQHLLKKTYVALVMRAGSRPTLEPEFVVKNHLKKVAMPVSRMVAAQSGGDYAETLFRVLQSAPEYALIEAQPLTGRMHQIRVHLSDLQLPILGDSQYGGSRAAKSAPRLMLHAQRLQLQHPTTGKAMTFESPLPDDFKDLLTSLKIT